MRLLSVFLTLAIANMLAAPVLANARGADGSAIPAQAPTTWIKHTGKSCQGFVNGNSTKRTLEASKALCLTNVECKAIECPTGATSSCTLRAKTGFIDWSSEDCYEVVRAVLTPTAGAKIKSISGNIVNKGASGVIIGVGQNYFETHWESGRTVSVGMSGWQLWFQVTEEAVTKLGFTTGEIVMSLEDENWGYVHGFLDNTKVQVLLFGETSLKAILPGQLAKAPKWNLGDTISVKVAIDVDIKDGEMRIEAGAHGVIVVINGPWIGVIFGDDKDHVMKGIRAKSWRKISLEKKAPQLPNGWTREWSYNYKTFEWHWLYRIKHIGKSCQGFVNGDSTKRTLEASKALCLTNVACKAIECPTGTTSSCTLRAKTGFIDWSSEDCYEFKATCFENNKKYTPRDMSGQSRTVESSAVSCQQRCASVSGCAHFSWWGDGGCHLQDARSNVTDASGVTAGPPACRDTQPGGGRRLSGRDLGLTVVV